MTFFRQYHALFISLFFIAVCFLLYSNTIGHQFVYDDFFYVTRPELRNWHYLPKLFWESHLTNNLSASGYRPLLIATIGLNFVLFGESPVSFHIANILVHAAMVCMAYFFTRYLFGGRLLPFVTALLFAFFPIHTENVAYVKARDDMLGAIFMLGSIWAVLHAARGKRPNIRPLVAGWILYALAMLTKELTAVAPIIAVFLAWQRGTLMVKNRRDVMRILIILSGFVAVFTGIAIIRIAIFGKWAFNTNDVFYIWNPLITASFVTRALTVGKIFFWYAAKTIAPVGLSASYAYNHFPIVTSPLADGLSLVGWGALILMSFVCLWPKTRNSPIGLGACLFLLPTVILLKIFYQASDIFAERWMYFPSLGIALIGGYFATRSIRRFKWVGIGVLLLLLTWYASVLIPRNRVWETRRTLAESIVRDAPDSVQGYYMLAVVNFNEGHIEEAKKLAKKSYDIYQEYPPVTYLLGRISYHENQYDDARRWFGTTITLSPTVSAPHKYYALMLTKLGRYQESLDHVREQFLRNPTDKQLRLIVGINYFELGDIAAARQILPAEVFTGEATRKQGLLTFPLDSWREQLIDEARRD